MANEGMYWLLYGFALNNVTFLEADGTVFLPTSLRLWQAKFDYQDLTWAKIMSEQNLNASIIEIARHKLDKLYKFNENYPTNNITKSMEIIYLLSGDIEFTCVTQKFADRIAKMPGTDVYSYVFVHKTKNNGFPNWTGAMHGYEIDYVFGMPFSEKWQNVFYNYTYDEFVLRLFVMKQWANFTRVGDPSKHEYIEPMSPRWPKYDVNSRKLMEIGTTFKVKEHHRTEFCRFWNEDLPNFVRNKMREERREPKDLCPSLEPYFNEHSKLYKFISVLRNGTTTESPLTTTTSG
ncbi:unnamed protein product [Dibothriocephalus latus]|uniref:Carboxylesterase type B domain-containing protein n=1 Tax=Dibothriocephalus latus TaxID=60516 RepID=A0A3P6Q652_DIBLA|nr:unnamed protein product [Dibothriocephalus latus]